MGGKLPDSISSLDFGIASHYYIWGAHDALFSYLRDRARSVIFLKHPFYYSDTKYSVATVARKSNENELRLKPRLRVTVIDYFLDSLFTFCFFGFYKRVHVLIAADPSNALAGILLRKLGLVCKVVFFATDYTPRRFSNSTLNKAYHLSEAYCAIASDQTWNISPRILEARALKLARLGRTIRPESQIVVRVPVDYSRVRPLEDLHRHSLVYSGNLGYELGLDAVFEAINALRQIIPDISLTILGKGPIRKNLSIQVREMGLSANVRFVEYISSRERFIEFLSSYAVGLAIYKPSDQTLVNFADVGKIKAYLGCGLPVIVTRHSYNSREVESANAGIVVSYDRKEIADALLLLLTDEEKFVELRRNAVLLAAQFSPEKIFGEALSRLLSA